MTTNNEAPGASTDGTPLALQLLAAGVPLSLLVDLATTVDSGDIYDREAGFADWLPAVVA